MDEPQDRDAEGPAPPARVRRRRSSSRSRRPRQVQGRVPFTGLRFMRPRLPTIGQALGLAGAVVALGLGVWALAIVNGVSATLTQTRDLLAVNTRGAVAGRQAADQLAARATSDTAQMMAAQDAAKREAARVSPGFGFGGGYTRTSPAEGGEGSGGSAPAPYGQTYGPGPPSYGSPPYGQLPSGVAPTASAPGGGGNVMGYTLPQTPP